MDSTTPAKSDSHSSNSENRIGSRAGSPVSEEREVQTTPATATGEDINYRANSRTAGVELRGSLGRMRQLLDINSGAAFERNNGETTYWRNLGAVCHRFLWNGKKLQVIQWYLELTRNRELTFRISCL